MKLRYNSAGSSLSPRDKTHCRNAPPASRLNIPSWRNAAECVGIQDFRPLVRVVAGRVPDRAREQVSESRDHGVVVGQRRRQEVLQNPARVGNHIAVARRLGSRCAAPGRRSRSPAGASGHWPRGTCARAFIFRKSSSGMSSPVSIVAREQVERLALPAPVLHDLRRQLHEVPGHVGSAPGCAPPRGSAGGAAGGRTRGRSSPLRGG